VINFTWVSCHAYVRYGTYARRISSVDMKACVIRKVDKEIGGGER